MSTQYEHRKSSARLIFLHSDGSPVQNARIQVRQTDSEFLFGFGAFDAVEQFREGISPEEQAVLKERLQKMLSVFNYGTLPFYWGRFEPEEGSPLTEITKQGAWWLKERGIKTKGHPLCWHTVCAPWLMQYDNRTILDKQLARIRREVTDFKGLIDTWDVINEVVIMPVFDKYDNAVTRIAKDLGRTGIVKAVFEAARGSNQEATLILNDFNMTAAYERLIADCLDAGIKIDVIGLQSHQHQGYWGREKVEDVLERFSRFGLPLHFTENTLVSGDLMPPHIVDLNDWQVEDWPSTPEGEARQAREVEEMCRLLFAHPQVEAVTVWDAVDGKWLNAPSGLLRRDNSEKPAFNKLREMVNEEWRSHQELITNDAGQALLSGYRGRYRLSLGEKSLDFTLKQGQEEVVLRL